MNLSDISIKNPVFAWMLMIGIIVFGFISFTMLGVSQLPDVDFPVLNISASWEGAAPEVMESEIADTIEDVVMGIEGVKDVFSTSRQGSTNITIQFELNKNVDVALQEVQSKIAQAQHDLPNDMNPISISKSNPEDQPIIWLALTGDMPLKNMMEYTKNSIKDQFSRVPGVGEIFLGGYLEPNLRVWLNAEKMKKYELTVGDIITAIQSQHAEIPAGYFDNGRNEQNVRVTGEAGSVGEFYSIIIPARTGSSPLWKRFVIGDVAEVEDGLENVRRLSRSMGKPSVGLGIRKQRGVNAVAVAHEVKAKLAEVQRYLPKGMKLEVRFDSTTYVEESIREIYFVMILAVLLTAFVCWLFLGSIASAFNVFLTIPLSIFGSFFVIKAMGFTLNTFTLLGLSLVIGIVVDDAIMVLENITRHRENGEKKIQAAIKGAREITFAAMAATLAILAIFIPVIFMKGIIGRYFFQFGITISAAVLISLLGALTLIPMFSAQFLSTRQAAGKERVMDRIMNWLRKKYTLLLGWCLENRWKVIIFAVIFFTGSLFLLGVIRKEFVPPQDQGRLNVRLQTKEGSSIDFTDEVFKQAEKQIMSHSEIDTYYTNLGGQMVNTGSISITMKDRPKRPVDKIKKRPLTQQEFIPILRKELKSIPGADRVVIQDMSLMGLTSQRGFPIEFTLNGTDWDKLADFSTKMAEKMVASGLMTDVDSDYRSGTPEIRVKPDREKSGERGVNVKTIGDTINALIGSLRVGKYTRGGKRYDIRVQLVSNERNDVKDLNKIWVRNNRGEVIRLLDVVSVSEKPSLLSITRKNRERAIRMFANVAPGKSQSDAMNVVQSIAKSVLPEGYKVVFTGSSQTYAESFSSLYFALIMGIFVAYMILGTQFNSFIHPFTVLLALPFSVSGAFVALALTNQSLNMYSMIGLILLMGIVKKNSILLVDFTNNRRLNGLGVKEALLEACPIRLRPILMTSVCTLVAAIPSALAMGPGAETRIPMAVVVIGGVFVSTLLTLFVVPCAYSLLSKLESKQHIKEVKEALKEFEK